MPSSSSGASLVYRDRMARGMASVASAKPEAMTRQNRSMMVTDCFRLGKSPLPQNRAVSTAAPIPMPMQQI